MLDNFHATLKLITGEEVLAQVAPTSENDQEFFVVSDPIVISETMNVDHQKGIAVSGLVPKKWQLYSSDNMTIIYKQHVVSISELDKFGIEFYEKALMAAKLSSPIKKRVDSKENVGYVGKVDDYRKSLENIFKISPDIPKESEDV